MVREHGWKREAFGWLEGIVAIAIEQTDHERAIRLLGAIAALREATGFRASRPMLVAQRVRGATAARAVLGDAAFTAVRAEGRAMTLEQAIEYALASGRPSGTV